MRNLRQLSIFLLVICAVSASAQKKLDYSAEGLLKGGRINGERVKRLFDNVVFTQKETTIYCDSAYFFEKRNVMEAFGRVRIVDDSVTITARKLFYDGDNRKAELRQNVHYTKGFSELTTDNLDYDLDAEISHYFGGGMLKDTTNTLESESGHFYAQQNYATFKKNVVLTAPTYTLKSEDLRYNTITKVATTPSETEIITSDQETTLFAEGGEFRTELDQSIFEDGQVETPNNFLEGDDLFFDQTNKYYKAEGNVKLIAKDKDIIITGDEGYNDEVAEISKIYGNPVMRRIMKDDTLFMSADTLVYVESNIDSLKRVLAYSNVKIFKSNLQGYADSSAYHLADSMIYMFRDPIMWSNNNQIEADTIKIEISDSTIHKMYLRKNAFLASEDTISNYNQIKGRDMTAYFAKGSIDEVDVNGNGEIIYYVLAEGDSIVMGMNRILCSNLTLRFDGQSLESMSAYVQPEGKFIPPHELTADVQKLDGFNWQGETRPTLEEVLTNNPRKKTEDSPTKSDGLKPPPDRIQRLEKTKKVKNLKVGDQ